MIRRLLVLLPLLLKPAFTHADLSVQQQLSFGQLVVTSNSTVQSVVIDSIGNVSFTTGIRPITRPQVGVIQLSDYPANAQVFVTISVSQATTNSTLASPEQFTLARVIAPPSIVTERDGTALLQFGGELQTSGSGSRNFADTLYSAQVFITLNF